MEKTMRSRTSDWFEVKIRYEKTVEDGTQKRVTEKYVVDALSFTEGEHIHIPVGMTLNTNILMVILTHGQEKVLYVIKKDKEDKYIKKA